MNYDEMVFGAVYYGTKDLRFDNRYKFFLSNQQLAEYKKHKQSLIERDPRMQALPLRSYNSACLFFTKGEALTNLWSTYLNVVFSDRQQTVFERNYQDMLLARVYSELEGSMQIENVPTTRTRLEQIRLGSDPRDKNELIARNMMAAIDYIGQKPTFDRDHLRRLYDILSKDCLEDGQKLNGRYYRDDAVYIDRYEGCPKEQIEQCMDSLFAYVDQVLASGDGLAKEFLPHVCHYYILYVHPYFDYNGRTARMVSLWISLLSEREGSFPLFLSEAINDKKKDYYDALRETRDMNNDLTYFLIYLLDTAIRYTLVYQNVDHIADHVLQRGSIMSAIDKVYVKKILLGASNGWFDYKKFLTVANVDISKQAALKALNKLADYGVLESNINEKKVKLFRLDGSWLKYTV